MTVETADARNSPGPAIATICLGVLCLVFNDAMAKWLTAHYGPLHIVFWRNILAVPMIAAFMPEVPQASMGYSGLFSQTSTPGNSSRVMDKL